MNAIEYFLQVNGYLLLFYIFYFILLRQETFFNLNRTYLLGSAVLSFLIPVLHADWINALFATPEVVSSKVLIHTIFIAPVVTTEAPAWAIKDVAAVIYFSVATVLFFRLIWKLIKVWFYADAQQNPAYSFFNRIFVSEKLSSYHSIYRHEATHARQFHSVDVILFELLAIIVWFNPVIYGYKKSLKHIHEFIADEAACKEETKVDYALLLLSNTLGVQPNQLVNSFFNQSLLKKRIIMLHKTKSNRAALIKYGLSVPLFAAMLVFSSAKMESGSRKIVQQASLAEPVIQFQQPEAISEALIPNSNPVKKPLQNTKAIADTIIHFAKVDVLPKFPDGGDAAFGKYVGSNINYPAEARKNNIEGRVIVSFIVEKDGALTDIKVLRDIGGGCGEEAVRVLKGSPKWVPGMQNGKAVRVAYTCPITFGLNKVTSATNLTIGNVLNDALYLLNEKEISAEEFKKLDPKTIRSVEVLKDSTATALYGEKGKNGVIKIITDTYRTVSPTPPATPKPNGK